MVELRWKRICDGTMAFAMANGLWIVTLALALRITLVAWPDLGRPIAAMIGMILVMASLALGAPPLVAALVPLAGVGRYLIYLLPLFKVIGNGGWALPISTWLTAALWESSTLTIPVLVAGWMIRGKAKAWAVFLAVAGLHAGLSVWLPRPYAISFGGILADDCPNLIWSLGADLTGGVVLGLAAMCAAAIRYERSLRSVLAPGIGCMLVVIVSIPAYRSWVSDRYLKDDRFDHEVILGQPNIRPFMGNFPGMSQYMLGPAVLLSSLGPDMIVMPEGLMQASYELDPRDEDAVEKRHLTAMTTGLVSPTSQIVFGVRDFKTARIYFTDIDTATQERLTRYKDLERIVPIIDRMPKFLGKMVGWSKDLDILPPGPESTPVMGVMAERNGIHLQMAKALISMSGEIRDGRALFNRVMNDRRIVIIVNPTISGWMGADESNGSVHQARARAIETGMILYRSGQTHGTEAFVPWGKYAIRGLAVRPLGGGTIQVGVYVPKLRPVTPYMSFTWMLAMLLMPASALVIVIGWAVPSARKDILTVGESR